MTMLSIFEKETNSDLKLRLINEIAVRWATAHPTIE